MERNRDLRRQAVSSVNGLPRGRKRICTLRDQTDQDRRMELQETVRLGGDKREFPKRRKTDWSAVQQKSDDGERYRENSTDSSDEEDYEMEEDMSIHRTNQLSPPSSSLPINRRGLRTLRSSPVLGAAVNEFFGGPVPRRARSSSAKRLHEYCNSGSSGLSEELNRRRFSPAPVGLIGSGDSLKKMRSVERRTTQIINPSEHPVVQDDIEIEVAEALFDLMKQSQSQSRTHSLQRQVEKDSVIPASDASKADGGKDENNAFSVQNEQSIKVNGETVLADPMNGLKEEETVEKKRFPDDSVQDLESGDGFVKKVKVGSPKESESPSCVKVNACDIQHPTMTKAHYDAIIVEAKKETKPEIDLMASPLISSPERKGLVDMRLDPGTMAQAVPKRGEITPLSMLDVEKHNHDTTYNGRKEHKNQSPTFLLPFPDGMGGWPDVPHPGHMPPLPADMPVNGSLKSSVMMQPPPFKFSASRPKKCATHQYLAQSMHCHQQLIKKSLSSDLSLCRAKSSPNLKYTYPAQNLIPGNPLMGDFQGGQNLAMASVGCGKDKSSDAAVAFNAMTSSMPLLQQASHPASASSFLGTMMAPTNSSGSPQSASLLSNSAGRFPINLSLPNASTTMSSNLPVFPSNEAASYFHNNGCSVPISTDIALPSFRGTPNAALNPSLYPSPPFSDMQNQQLVTTSHASLQSASQNTNLLSHTGARISETKYPTSATSNSQPEKLFQPSSKSDTVANWKNGASGPVSHSVKPSNLQTRSSSAQPMHFAMIPPVSVGGDGGCSKPIDPPQQGSKGRVELIPQAFALSFGSNSSATPMLNFSSMAPTCAMFQMLPDMSRSGNQMIQHKNFQTSEGKYSASGGEYSKSDCSEISALSTPKFDGLARNFSFLPSDSQPFAALSSGFQQHQLIQIQDFHMHQKQLAGTGQVKSSAPHNIPGSFFTSGSQVSAPKDSLSFHQKWENFPRSEGSPQLKTSQGQSLVNFGNGPMSATSFQGHQFMIKNDSMSSPIVGSSSSSSFSRSSQRNASSLGLAASTTTSVLPS